MAYPQTLTLNAGDKLLYTGTCQLQVSIVLPDGNTQPVASVSAGSFAEAPVTTTYELKIVGGTRCCVSGDHVVYPATPADGGGTSTNPSPANDIEISTVCRDGYKWEIHYRFVTVDGVTTKEVLAEENTGLLCQEPECPAPTALGVISDTAVLDNP